MDPLTEDFIAGLEGLVGAVQFIIVSKPDDEQMPMWCVIKKEEFEVADGNNIIRETITTASEYGLKRNDLIKIINTEEQYTVGADISKNDIRYEALLDSFSGSSNVPIEDEPIAIRSKEIIYGASKDILVAGENITLDVNDGESTITINGQAGGPGGSIGDKTITEAQLSDEVDARLLPSPLGTSGQIPAVNSAGDGTEWVDRPRDGIDGAPGQDGRDAIITDKSITEAQLSDEVDARLLPNTLGTSGQVLTINSDEDGVGYENIPEFSIADGSIGTDQLADGAVVRSKLGNSSVGEGQLGINSVTATKIKNEAVGLTKLASPISARLLPESLGTSGQVLSVNSAGDGVTYVDRPRDGQDGAPGQDGNDATVTINYYKVAKNGTNWTDLVTGTNYNADYVYRITAIVNSDHTETVSIRGDDLALASGNAGLKMFIRNNARSCDLRLNKGKIQGRLNDSATCIFTVMWVPVTVTTVTI